MNLTTSPVCPLCSELFKYESYTSVPYPAVKRSSSANIPNAINLCGNCGAGVAVPSWSSDMLDKFYSSGGYWNKAKIETVSAKKFPTPYALAVSRWKMIESLLTKRGKPVSVLDIGAGYGLLGMVAARSKKVSLAEYACVEKDASVVESFKKMWLKNFPRINLEVKDSVEQVNKEFDVVVLSHVLEHQSNPKEMLQMVLKKVATGGLVFVEVPNQDYLFKNDVFPHLIFFTALGMRIFLMDCGLTVKSIGCYGHSMKRSPLNYRNITRLRSIFLNFVMSIRKIIPESVLLSFFTRYWGTNMQNNDGTWLRAVLQKDPSGKQVKNN